MDNLILTTYTPEQLTGIISDAVTEDKEIEGLIPRSVLVDLYIDKFGKKPHHRMNDDSIKAALDADHT